MVAPSNPAARTIIVAGMHRSGTSLIAGLLGRLGVHLGEHLIEADDWNQHGYHEDADLVKFHGRLFRALWTASGPGHVDWGWVEGQDINLHRAANFREEAIQLANRRSQQSSLWGFKDPRTSLLLEFWDSCIPDARFVFVYRAPWLVADSMQRIEADLFRQQPEYAAPIWALYNQRILDFHRKHKGRCILVNVDALPAGLPQLRELLASRIGIAQPEVDLLAGFDGSVLRKATDEDPARDLTAIAFPDCARLYNELESAADLPSNRPPTASGPRTLGAQAKPNVVSIIIPTYNDAPLLLDALASIAKANLSGVEVVIIDDGSTHPQSVRILDSLASAGHWILRTPNRGLAAARNAGIAASTGRYLLPLDADNRLLPGFIEDAVAVLDTDSKIGIAHSNWRQFGGRTDVVHVPAFQIQRMASGNYIDACAVFRRELWEDLGGYYEGISAWEDWEFWLHAHSKGWRFHHLQRTGFEYRVRAGSLLARSCRAGTRHLLRDRILRRHPQTLLDQMPDGWRRLSRCGTHWLPTRLSSAWSRTVTRTYWHAAWEWAGLVQGWHPAKTVPTKLPSPTSGIAADLPTNGATSIESEPIFVVIPAYEGGEGLLQCVESVVEAGLPPSHVVIVDNASRDEAPGRADKAFPGITLLRNQSNLGFAAACNRGIDAARRQGARYILLLNQDARATPGLFARLHHCARQHPTAGIIGPRVCSNIPLPDGSVRRLYAGAWRGLLPLDQRVPGSGQSDTAPPDQPCLVDFVYGCAMFLRTEALPPGNTFDPAFFMYHEDVDLCLRMKDAGWQCWCDPVALVWHDITDLARFLPIEEWRWQHKFESARTFLRKRFRRPIADLLLAAHYFGETSRALRQQGPRAALQLLRVAMGPRRSLKPENSSKRPPLSPFPVPQ